MNHDSTIEIVFQFAFSTLTQLGSRKGIQPVRNMGDGGGEHWLVWMEWRPAGWSMCLPVFVNLPLHHKDQKFSSGTSSPGWSRKKGRKTVVVWWWWFVRLSVFISL